MRSSSGSQRLHVRLPDVKSFTVEIATFIVVCLLRSVPEDVVYSSALLILAVLGIYCADQYSIVLFVVRLD